MPYRFDPLNVLGRVSSVRVAGTKLLFLDIEEETRTVQIVLNNGLINGAGDVWANFKHIVRRGDWYSMLCLRDSIEDRTHAYVARFCWPSTQDKRRHLQPFSHGDAYPPVSFSTPDSASTG